MRRDPAGFVPSTLPRKPRGSNAPYCMNLAIRFRSHRAVRTSCRILIPIVAAIAGLAGCYRVPVTGRSALSLVDDKEVVRMSALAFNDIKKRYRVSRDPRRVAQLERV